MMSLIVEMDYLAFLKKGSLRRKKSSDQFSKLLECIGSYAVDLAP